MDSINSKSYKIDKMSNEVKVVDVKGYEGLYQISSDGVVYGSRGSLKPIRGWVSLSKDGKKKSRKVSELLDDSFAKVEAVEVKDKPIIVEFTDKFKSGDVVEVVSIRSGTHLPYHLFSVGEMVTVKSADRELREYLVADQHGMAQSVLEWHIDFPKEKEVEVRTEEEIDETEEFYASQSLEDAEEEIKAFNEEPAFEVPEVTEEEEELAEIPKKKGGIRGILHILFLTNFGRILGGMVFGSFFYWLSVKCYNSYSEGFLYYTLTALAIGFGLMCILTFIVLLAYGWVINPLRDKRKMDELRKNNK